MNPTSFAYDAFGRVTQTTFPSTLHESYIYDAVGNLASKTDRNGHSILYVYDALNRLTHKGYPDSTGVDYVYDLAGKIKQVTDPTGTFGMAYDNMGRSIGTTTQYSFLPGHTYSNTFAYDAASNRTGFTAPDASTNTYAYDTLNRMSILTSSLVGQFGFSFDGLSRRTQLTRPNGVTSSYGYDPVSHLQSIVHKLGANTLDGATYTSGLAGNRTSKNNLLNNAVSNFSYDNIYQLMGVTGAGPESYTFDPVGNRITSPIASNYAYNSSNELTAAGSATYTYDNNGNILTKITPAGTTTYTWDFENRLTSVQQPGPTTVTFKYDPFGRRIQKGNSVYLYEGANLIEETDSGGNLVARYVFGGGIDQPLSASRGGTTEFYQADGLGSITSLSTSAGIVSDSFVYDSFGNVTSSTGSFAQPFRYTGREWDAETGLYYYRARYYDPQIRRFISSDPSGFGGGLNSYAYVGSNPISLIDPSGLDWIEYTGQTLKVWPGKFKDRGHPPILECKATSGMEGYQSPDLDNGEYGPVRHGEYRIDLSLDPKRWASIVPSGENLAAANGVQRIRDYYTGPNGEHLVPAGWGTWRARLQPMNVSTKRGNFYLHNSTKGYTHGCVETCDSLYNRFVTYHDQGLAGIDVLVDYTTNSTNGGTKIP